MVIIVPTEQQNTKHKSIFMFLCFLFCWAQKN